MIYKYKIQWLITRKQFDSNISFKHLLNILGVKSLDKIVLRNNDFKIVDTYTSFIMFPFNVAEIETIKYLKKTLKQNNNIEYIELIRK